MHDKNAIADITTDTNGKSTTLPCDDTGKPENVLMASVGIVYRATCLINGKVYIGVTSKTLEKRKHQHFRLANKLNPDYLFHKAIRKYGIENFTFEGIDVFNSIEERNNKEIQYIITSGSFYLDGRGYNMTRGGDGSLGHFFSHTEQARRKISSARLGKRKSDETREKMRNAQKKRKSWFTYTHSDEARQKISIASKSRKRASPSVETREKLRRANVGKTQSKETVEKRRKQLIGKVRSQSYRAWLSEKKKKTIPAHIYSVIVECVRLGLTPYHISEKLSKEHGYKIDRKTIKKTMEHV